MKFGLTSPVLLLALAGQVCLAGQWYVAPDGKPANPGKKQAPWDIASALSGEQQVAAGDCIHLLEGTYKCCPKELYEIRRVGTESAPINIRPAPGSRVRIDGGLSMQSPSEHVWVRATRADIKGRGHTVRPSTCGCETWRYLFPSRGRRDLSARALIRKT